MAVIVAKGYAVVDIEVYNYHCSFSLYYICFSLQTRYLSIFLVSFTLIDIYKLSSVNFYTELERIVIACFLLFTIVSVSAL